MNTTKEPSAPIRISVVMTTLNEEKRIGFALSSVCTWVTEIIVVDMHSEDRTVEIARRFGANVFFYDRIDTPDPARVFALEQATGDWILILDADELIPAPLSKRLTEIAAKDEADVVCIHWQNYFLGAPLLHAMSDDKHVRFFKKGYVAALPILHRTLEPIGTFRYLEIPKLAGVMGVHFAYRDVSQFIEKLNQYTTVEAHQKSFTFGGSKRPLTALFVAVRRFLGRFIYYRGFLDGWRGFYWSMFMAFYVLVGSAKAVEMNAVGPREVVEESYRQEAEKILSAYGDMQHI